MPADRLLLISQLTNGTTVFQDLQYRHQTPVVATVGVFADIYPFLSTGAIGLLTMGGGSYFSPTYQARTGRVRLLGTRD